VEADRRATVLDGSAGGLAGLAALGAMPAGRIAYAGDLSPAELRGAAAGGEVVISDSNRRRVQAAARMAQNTGATLAASGAFSTDAAVVDPFPLAGADAQTVVVYQGVTALRSPSSPAYSQFPERRPFAAFDGNPGTHWQADRALLEERHWLEVEFTAPRDVDRVDLLPYSDRRGRVTVVEVAGRRFSVRPGWNNLRLGLRGVRRLRVRIAEVARPGEEGGAGGIRELRVPGLSVREALRPAGAGRAGAGGRRAAVHRPQLRLRAHDGRRPVPARPPAGLRGSGARARPARRRERARAGDRPAGGARSWSARRVGDGRGGRAGLGPRRADRGRVGAAGLLRALPGTPGLPGLERVRRDAAAVDRLVARRPRGVAELDRAARA
jgi:hypothetical protein